MTMVDVLPGAAPLEMVATSDQSPSAEQLGNAVASSVSQEAAAQQQPADLPQPRAEPAAKQPAEGKAPMAASMALVSTGDCQKRALVLTSISCFAHRSAEEMSLFQLDDVNVEVSSIAQDSEWHCISRMKEDAPSLSTLATS